MGNYYRFLKEKQKEITRDNDYIDLLSNILISMFDYKNVYDGFYKKNVEMAFIHNGMVMTTEIDGALCSIPCNYTGIPNDNGEYTDFKGWTLNGKIVDGVRDEDCIIGYNNDIGMPDLNIERYATVLSDIDLSIDYGVINSRNVPIPAVKDSKTKKAIEEAQKAIREGKPAVVLDENILNELENGTKNIDIVNLTDVDSADKMQYLSKLHDDFIRRWATVYGHDFNGSPKSAQQSIKEIEGSESFSWIIPYNMLKCRKEWCEKINEMFGTNMIVDFSPTWKVQFNKFMQLDDVPEDMQGDDQEDIEMEGDEKNGIDE